ncbi:MAG: aconitate hydratase AcnA [Candidatus Palauibacterales bacterium]|nr:aconitate hydratase AcnA [Candidatus Palauibacterales bacterium]
MGNTRSASLDTFGTRRSIDTRSGAVDLFDLRKLEREGVGDVSRLPYSIRILLENLLRYEDGEAVTADDIRALADWDPEVGEDREIAFQPSRVLLQDFTGVPSVVDLAAMRDAMARLGGDPAKVDPVCPAEMVIDHSVQVDSFGTRRSFEINVEREFERNRERYAFLRWGQKAFDSLKVVPPGTGIVHQVNLEYLARVVFRGEDSEGAVAYPDTLVGTDSHTPMINGLGVLGWGVGGIEAEAAMLGEPISLLIPRVVGFRMHGELPEGATATDLVLRVTEMLREHGVVQKFVEFYGPGIQHLSLADRATLGNMSPEYGGTCAIFPVDDETLDYLRFTGRDEERVDLVERYMKEQGLFHTESSPEPDYSEHLELDLSTVEPSLAGPKLPQERIPLTESRDSFERVLAEHGREPAGADGDDELSRWEGDGGNGGTAVAARAKSGVDVRLDEHPVTGKPVEFELRDGAVVIAAITSCTNTSNPAVMVGAGLLARNAAERGLKSKPWVKTSLAPGSQVVMDYLEEAELIPSLEELGFNLVAFGCTTCIGNSGPLPGPISEAIRENDLVACSVLSGNRNFEGRINPYTRANYLASPPLVVAYALAGRMDIDLYRDPLGTDGDGNEVYLEDIWPSQEEIRETIRSSVRPEMFEKEYAEVFTGDERWNSLEVPESELYEWDDSSTYIRKPPFFEDVELETEEPGDIEGARCLVKVGDSLTTDHISPAGAIPKDSPAGEYLQDLDVGLSEFNSYGSRRGNHEVLMRGTFANIRLRNQLVPGTEGWWTKHLPSGEKTSVYDAAMRYREEDTPLVVIGGDEFGTGSSRDWAAKGPVLLGVEAVLATGYERIFRSNLIGMGGLPLQFQEGDDAESLGLTGEEVYDIRGIPQALKSGTDVSVTARRDDGTEVTFPAHVRLDTPMEVKYYRHGGILHSVLRRMAAENGGEG